MDPRSTPHHPFPRPLSEHSLRDSRNVPLPPPPYTLQAPIRQSHPTLTNEPFLPRRNERSDPRQAPGQTLPQSPFSLEKYAASLSREAPASAMMLANGQQQNLRDSDGAWRSADRGVDGSMHRNIHDSGSTLPPPPPTSSFPSTLQDPLAQKELQRQQGYRTDSTTMYGAAQKHSPPPPPPFSARPMLPPSPQYNPPASMSRGPPPPPPFSAGRETAAFSSTSRPGSSMSISSMLDSAPGRPHREPISATINGTSPPAPYSSAPAQLASASSPTRSNNRNEILNGSSLEKYQTTQTPTSRPFRAYSTGKANSPDGIRFGPPPANSISQQSPRSDHDTQQDWNSRHDRNTSVGRIINRPSSQPNGYTSTLLDVERLRAENHAQLAERAKHEENVIKEASLRQANRDRVSSFDFLGRQAQLDRQQRLEREKMSAHQDTQREDRLSGMGYPFMTQSSVFSEPSMSTSGSGKESVLERLLDRNYQPNSNTGKGTILGESRRHLHEERQNSIQTQNQSLIASRQSFQDKREERQLQAKTQDGKFGTGIHEGKPGIDGFSQQLRNADEGIQNHRSMLTLLNDNNKRAGRVSPLPQAVQGAQGPKRGPSSDPSIKNEFSRMFSGIGSGVGSTGLNSGASTPFPPSPKQNQDADQRPMFNGRGELLDFPKSRNGSRVGMRGKRVKEAEPKELEITEERSMTGGPRAKGIRKSRHTQPHHHHIHHRHHHHHIDAPNGVPTHQLANSSTPKPRHHPHHHHHHHPDGRIHPHSPSKSSTSHLKIPRVPLVQINNDLLLETIRDVPRRHLGSTLYSPSLESSLSPATYDSRSRYTTAPYTIPRCEGKENCTLTVRIPRFYLSKEERERVCLGRAVWGTDIYTDDSDPLAAAIHAGWIRGEWGDGIDFSMLELNPGNDSDTKDTIFTSVPATAMLPLPGKDLHLTLVILPALQNYTSHVVHGVRSRHWGSDHDGLSYRIDKIAWVDEKAGRGEERDGESRHKRLKTATGSRATVPPVRLGLGKALGNRMAVSAAA